eukprot:GHVH01006021.1.p1 GENE.GHVH01006021.1~~GHVH01006021.1.p1  ORF type:complete len:370 (+),score=37.21 GHVH01006021.1:248-1357(+)
MSFSWLPSPSRGPSQADYYRNRDREFMSGAQIRSETNEHLHDVRPMRWTGPHHNGPRTSPPCKQDGWVRYGGLADLCRHQSPASRRDSKALVQTYSNCTSQGFQMPSGNSRSPQRPLATHSNSKPARISFSELLNPNPFLAQAGSFDGVGNDINGDVIMNEHNDRPSWRTQVHSPHRFAPIPMKSFGAQTPRRMNTSYLESKPIKGRTTPVEQCLNDYQPRWQHMEGMLDSQATYRTDEINEIRNNRVLECISRVIQLFALEMDVIGPFLVVVTAMMFWKSFPWLIASALAIPYEMSCILSYVCVPLVAFMIIHGPSLGKRAVVLCNRDSYSIVKGFYILQMILADCFDTIVGLCFFHWMPSASRCGST